MLRFAPLRPAAPSCDTLGLRPRLRRWIPDELSPPAFARLAALRRVPVATYDPRFDVWLITVPLSEGCGGPELPEEMVV